MSTSPYFGIAETIARYEAQATRKDRPAGSDNGGLPFERRIGVGIGHVIRQLLSHPSARAFKVRVIEEGKDTGKLHDKALAVQVGPRTLVFNLPHMEVPGLVRRTLSSKEVVRVPDAWMRRNFELTSNPSLRADLGLPAQGTADPLEVLPEFAGLEEQFSGLEAVRPVKRSTSFFDGVILCIENHRLVGRIVIEAKSGKSSDGDRLDGNAHERASHKVNSFLLLAEAGRFTGAKLLIATNDAFARYQNSFMSDLQAMIALFNRSFPRFHGQVLTEAKQYAAEFELLDRWLRGESVALFRPVMAKAA
jgi:hypothetical protein